MGLGGSDDTPAPAADDSSGDRGDSSSFGVSYIGGTSDR